MGLLIKIQPLDRSILRPLALCITGHLKRFGTCVDYSQQDCDVVGKTLLLVLSRLYAHHSCVGEKQTLLPPVKVQR